jgi:hypothetical protein
MQEKKKVEERSADAKLKKELGLLALTAVGVGGMIGSGTFSIASAITRNNSSGNRYNTKCMVFTLRHNVYGDVISQLGYPSSMEHDDR